MSESNQAGSYQTCARTCPRWFSLSRPPSPLPRTTKQNQETSVSGCFQAFSRQQKHNSNVKSKRSLVAIYGRRAEDTIDHTATAGWLIQSPAMWWAAAGRREAHHGVVRRDSQRTCARERGTLAPSLASMAIATCASGR